MITKYLPIKISIDDSILHCLHKKHVNLKLLSKDYLNQHSHCGILIFHGADYQDSKKKVLVNTIFVVRPLMSKLGHNKTSNSPVTLSLIIKISRLLQFILMHFIISSDYSYTKSQKCKTLPPLVPCRQVGRADI